MATLLTIFYILVCFFLIAVVLLQQGKGADLAGAFGGGGSQTAFGPRTGPTLMHKLTTGSFVLFIVLSMALAIMHGKRARSVMEHVSTKKPAATQPAPAEKPAAKEAVPAAKPEGAATQGQSAPAAEQKAAPAAAKQAPVAGQENPASKKVK
ncbi:MAG: preprotein translocase subunit SecG [Acidobacteria bacterium]|nr:preprotein translocase subunit SecG [Acidobacteriota bacterium]